MEWTNIDTSKVDLPTERTLNGLTVTVHTSPYQVPTAARLIELPNELTLLEFRYFDEEPWERSQIDGFSVRLGKRSGRIVGIEIPKSLLTNKDQELTVKLAAKQLSGALPKASFSAPLQTVKNAPETWAAMGQLASN